MSDPVSITLDRAIWDEVVAALDLATSGDGAGAWRKLLDKAADDIEKQLNDRL